jgi:dipicolinate synthase subunit A
MKKTELKAFGIIGGDKRQLFLAKSISDSCFDVTLGGFDKLTSLGAIEIADIKTAVSKSDAIIFPLPSICADGTLNTPFSDKKTRLSDALIALLKDKPMFVAMKNKFLKEYPVLSNCQIYDYSAKEEFAVANALLTAEGAVNIAMNEYEGTIFGSKCLVCGFGRIGKMLAKMLKSLNADVTVSARNEVDFAYIDALGCKHINTNSLKSVKGYDLVFNTIPVMIFDGNLLMNTDRNTIIIDLASLPGGVDFEAAKRYKTDAVRALSLPGRTAPKAAGEIIRKTIFNIIKEVYR